MWFEHKKDEYGEPLIFDYFLKCCKDMRNVKTATGKFFLMGKWVYDFSSHESDLVPDFLEKILPDEDGVIATFSDSESELNLGFSQPTKIFSKNDSGSSSSSTTSSPTVTAKQAAPVLQNRRLRRRGPTSHSSEPVLPPPDLPAESFHTSVNQGIPTGRGGRGSRGGRGRGKVVEDEAASQKINSFFKKNLRLNIKKLDYNSQTNTFLNKYIVVACIIIFFYFFDQYR